ncbi:MAG: hypothetical protein ACKV22_28625 [Bryobacteraceae bacterium]
MIASDSAAYGVNSYDGAGKLLTKETRSGGHASFVTGQLPPLALSIFEIDGDGR